MTAPREVAWFRAVLLATAVMNVLGCVTFLPHASALRATSGLPDPGPLYGWVFALWVLFFGIGYGRLAFAETEERLFLWLGAAGKASFALVLAALWLGGHVPGLAALAGLPDLVFAVLFVVWLVGPAPDTGAHGRPGR